MGTPVRIMIVEDEFLTLNNIRESLVEMGYEVSGGAKNAEEALRILDQKETDMAILDIQIQGDRNGIWLANEINEKYKIPFIFLTAFGDQKTIRTAMNVDPYGYLVKPFNSIDVYTAIEVALRNYERRDSGETEMNEDKLTKETAPVLIDDHLFIKERHLYSKVKVSDIQFVKAEMKSVFLKTSGNEFCPRYTFSEFVDFLPKDHFIQVHRSYVVNRASVDHIGPNFLMIGKQEIPISSGRKEEVYEAFKFI